MDSKDATKVPKTEEIHQNSILKMMQLLQKGHKKYVEGSSIWLKGSDTPSLHKCTERESALCREQMWDNWRRKRVAHGLNELRTRSFTFLCHHPGLLLHIFVTKESRNWSISNSIRLCLRCSSSHFCSYRSSLL